MPSAESIYNTGWMFSSKKFAMKPFHFLAVLLITVSSLFADEPIRVLSINVRCSTANDGVNSWLNRRDFMTDLILEGDYDFIGTQETVMNLIPELNQVKFIASKLPRYGYFGRSREVLPNVGEAMVIFYKKNRWKIDPREHKTFWLSATPNIAGSKTDPMAGCPRSVTVALFHELKNKRPTGRKIYIYNTHFDHRSEEAQQRAAKQLMEHIAKRKNRDIPVLVMGDMNCGEQSPAIRLMKGDTVVLDNNEWRSSYRLVDTFRVVHPNATDVGTFNGFKASNESKIDYIFISRGLKTISAEIIRTQREGRYPTDHFPINAVISW